jgi:hypothetical protein
MKKVAEIMVLVMSLLVTGKEREALLKSGVVSELEIEV